MRLRIGIFSDDIGASHAAAMVVHGLSAIGRKVGFAAPEFRPGGDLRAASNGLVSTIALPSRVNAFEVQSLLERFDLRDADRIVSLPLDALRDPAVRIQFDAVLAVGRDLPAAEKAFAAARYGTGETVVQDAPPAWFLACRGQHNLWTRANLRPVRGPRLPFATRVLPAAMPRFAGERAHALLEGRPDIDAVRDGILLAAVVVAVAADPHAGTVDAATVDHLMATRDLAGEREASDLLVALASEYDFLEDAAAGRVAERWATSVPSSERRITVARRRPAPMAGRPAIERDGVRMDAVWRTP